MLRFRNLVFALILALSLLPETMRACEICGCGAGNLYFGILPNSERHLLGIRFRNIHYRSHLYPNDPYAKLFETREQFRVYEVLGRFKVSSRWNVNLFLPFAEAKQERINRTFYRQGLADATIWAQYKLLDTERLHPEWDWKQQAQFGAGVKMPTGVWKFGEESAGSVENANFQPGTGSWDFLLTGQYLLRFKSIGLQSDVQWRYNTTNPDDHRFGNRISGNVNVLYYRVWKGPFSLMPFAGCYGEFSEKNTDRGYKVLKTGGTLWMLNSGLQIHWKRYSLLAQWQHPIRQNLSMGHIQAQDRGLIQAAMAF
jgi:hypothetical protein